ncbi:NAD(P)-dependent oxidoreductase [Undibacterium sp. SXout7W]|uniref:NAD(P)-dependent oxidoreductase n=1 Tax=Undibacterium sp. SXout7W TaxID=3413049 RepID=UPI003BEF5163
MNQVNIFPRIAFLGIGLMGRGMAKRLLAAGYSVSVWNRTTEKAQSLVAFGADVAKTAIDAVSFNNQQADIIITMLEAGAAVEQTIQAILPALKKGSILIDMSSTQQGEARRFFQWLSPLGVHFIDAPVSGGVIGAEAGTLAIMAGAEVAAYTQAESVLKVMGNPLRVGEPGTGQLAKLCNQLIVGGTINIVAEALLLAQAGGADPVAVRQALRGGFAESRILEVHGQRMLDRSFMPGGQVKSQAKDMENIQIAARDAGLTLPVTQVVTNAYRALLPVYPAADHSAALLELESKNPGKRLGDKADQLPG